MNAIEKAAEAALKLAWEMVGYTGEVDWASTQSVAEEIKRELEKAVPAAIPANYGSVREAAVAERVLNHLGLGECRKAFLGEAIDASD